MSHVPPNVAYFKTMLQERRAMYKKAVAMKIGQVKWEGQIKELYKVNKWQKLNRVGKIVADPWKMLKDFEKKYREKYPQYESPWEPRGRNFRDFQRKTDKTLARQGLR
jgi:hypothetical protein